MKMGAFVRIGLAGVLCYILYCLSVFLVQRKIVFPRHVIDVPSSVEGLGHPFETWWLETDFGKIEAWFLPATAKASRSPAPAVIFAHGNAEVIDFWPVQLQGFADMGLGVLLVEYPGYGRSEGLPSQATITDVFLKAYDRLARHPEVDSERIILLGRSLGGGVACAVASERPCAALMVMSSFTSIRALSWKLFVPPFLARDPFDNLEALTRYKGPVLVIHGRFDSLVPYAHGRALASAAERGRLITYACGHNDCPPDWAMFWNDVRDFFLDAHILAAPKHHKETEGNR